jgi:guanylate cyclase
MNSKLKQYTPQLAAFVKQLRDPPEERLGRFVLGMMVIAETLVSVFWIYAFSGLGDGYAVMAFFPYAYIVISYASLLLFYHFQRFEYFTFTQLVMLLVMPFFMQWIIGGFVASSGVSIWGVLAPVGALMILGTSKSTGWFMLFLGLMAFSWLTNDLFAGYALPIPKHTQMLFFFANVSGVATILYLVMRYFETQKERVLFELDNKNGALLLEQYRSDRLLLNILPKSVADRLKQNNEARIADRYESVTIMFADLVDFTRISAGMSPEALVDLLGSVFSRFDELTEKHGVEKIKTIGDAYMVVCGAPEARADHAEAVANLAIDMKEALAEVAGSSGYELMMRIGINSGPVVAGVIGSSKFSYDLWGDTVNMASRMEHYGQSNVIQVSESTYELLRDKFVFEKRNLIEVKGKGNVQSYFLLGRIDTVVENRTSITA